MGIQALQLTEALDHFCLKLMPLVTVQDLWDPMHQQIIFKHEVSNSMSCPTLSVFHRLSWRPHLETTCPCKCSPWKSGIFQD